MNKGGCAEPLFPPFLHVTLLMSCRACCSIPFETCRPESSLVGFFAWAHPPLCSQASPSTLPPSMAVLRPQKRALARDGSQGKLHLFQMLRVTAVTWRPLISPLSNHTGLTHVSPEHAAMSPVKCLFISTGINLLCFP